MAVHRNCSASQLLFCTQAALHHWSFTNLGTTKEKGCGYGYDPFVNLNEKGKKVVEESNSSLAKLCTPLLGWGGGEQ